MQIPAFSDATVLIVGDVMLDRYWYGSTGRISPEAPVPVVQVKQQEERPGGAGNVALNITALGAKAILLGQCGDDEAARSLEEKLLQAQVHCHLNKKTNYPTTTKLRVLSLHQQLIRLDFEMPEQIDYSDLSLFAQYEKLLPQAKVVILSDYAKGVLNDVPAFIKIARAHNIPVLIDPKGNDFHRYHGASLLTPNFKEFQDIVGVCKNDAEILSKGRALIDQLDLQALLVTRGEHGMTLIERDQPELHLPARQQEVYDVTGAGDTVIGVLAASYAAGETLAHATFLANVAAGIVVTKLGAATVSVPELRRTMFIDQQATHRGILSETELLTMVADARAHGEKLVMTNGCFDILHAGHVAYLEEAKALGDRLIVAVNDDASVRNLKGSERPINSLPQRMAVLAGLQAVDWVVAFSEATPERLVSEVLPDVLVKGGDYQISDLPEAKPVLANGGEVKILQFVNGCSTSNIINKIQHKESR